GPRAAASRRWSRRGCCRAWPGTSCRSTSRPPPGTPRPACCGPCTGTSRPWRTTPARSRASRSCAAAAGPARRGRACRSRSGRAGKKVLIVLDQFEQWLHARRTEDDTDLVRALRQCDGGRVQAVVLVRDDFWMAATRFMRDLEVPLVEGHSSAAVDLFDPRHA